jgi:hypothetical protein
MKMSMNSVAETREAATAAATAAAELLRTKAEALRSYVGDEGNQLRDLAVEKADEARRYLSRKGVSGLGRDVVAVAKEHPVAAVATAVGLAYLASRVFRRD